MVRNILLAALISTFALFGALGATDVKTILTCLVIGIAAWLLCAWRCTVLYRRISHRRSGEKMFNEYARRNFSNNARR